MDSSAQTEDRASDWLTRRHTGNWTEQDQRELDQWLAQSFENRVAYLRLEAVWDKAARLKAFAVNTQPGEVPEAGQWLDHPFFAAPNEGSRESRAGAAPVVGDRVPPSRFARVRTNRLFAVAATTLAIVFAASLAYTYLPRENRYTTPVGGTASIPLTDGSKITLNTASEIHVDLGKKERRVELEHGEAYFQVARDPARPFVVDAGDKRVIAVGTQFSVRRDGTDVRVTVTEGTVRMESVSGANLLTAGATARASQGSVLVTRGTAQQAEDSLSWRAGYLVFEETTLADAVAEFNRYTRQRIVIEDPRIAAIRINGKFRSDSAEIFIRLLHDGYNIDTRTSDDAVVLTTSK